MKHNRKFAPQYLITAHLPNGHVRCTWIAADSAAEALKAFEASPYSISSRGLRLEACQIGLTPITRRLDCGLCEAEAIKL